MRRRSPDPIVARMVLVAFALFVVAYVSHTRGLLATIPLTLPTASVTVVRTMVELVAAWYGLAFAFNAVVFVLADSPPVPYAGGSATAAPTIGIVYLCCEDADARALRSLATLDYPGTIHVVIHDDSHTPLARRLVDALASELAATTPFHVHLLRRPDRTGGKPAAVNYVLSRTQGWFEYFLLCDNDSTVIDPQTVQKALRHMADSSTAIVQLRPCAVETPGTCAVNRLLGRSITAFHAFLLPCSRFGWMPFIGHNALLRARAVLEVGGLTPGFFSDDLDLTVRLNLAGYRVAYAPDIAMGETHPPSYAAFRRRSYKWAYGCMQTLKAHTWALLRSPRHTIAEKMSFLQFAGFYALQAALLVYLIVAFVLTPLVAPAVDAVDARASIVAGSVIVLLIYLPILAYALKEGGDRAWAGALLLCGLAYGATDFVVARGVWDGLRGHRRQWTPTNAMTTEQPQVPLFAEACFGLVLFVAALIQAPALLWLPCSYLFAGKFLFGPALCLLYQDAEHTIPIESLAPSGIAAMRVGST